MPWVEAKTGISLAPSQREVLALAAHSKALMITGGHGVGKTTLVNAILRVLAAKRLVVLVGSRRALAIAVRNGNARRRWTRLREWLGGTAATGTRA